MEFFILNADDEYYTGDTPHGYAAFSQDKDEAIVLDKEEAANELSQQYMPKEARIVPAEY